MDLITRETPENNTYSQGLAGPRRLGWLIEEDRMIPLYEAPHFTFRFEDDRIIGRFILEDIESGRRVTVFQIDADSGERRNILATTSVGEGGWVDLPEPIVVRAGEAFIAVPAPASQSSGQ